MRNSAFGAPTSLRRIASGFLPTFFGSPPQRTQANGLSIRGALSKRLLKLKIGSRICITTRNIGHLPGLKCIHSVRDLMTSWGNLDTCFVFERVADVAPASLGPKAEFERVWGPPP